MFPPTAVTTILETVHQDKQQVAPLLWSDSRYTTAEEDGVKRALVEPETVTENLENRTEI